MCSSDLDGAPSVVAEASVPDATAERLEAAGFPVTRLTDLNREVGHAQLILVHDDGRLSAGSDPRADGAALAGEVAR